MKDKEHSLLYHTMHSRPMPGCLPLFFLLATGVVALGIWLVPVKMPERVRPQGVGRVYIKNDRLTDFVLRRQSPIPLHLPQHADPEYQEDMAAAAMPLQNAVKLASPPPQPMLNEAADSAVLNAEELLALPGEERQELPSGEQDTPAEPPQPVPDTPSFHPAVEAETEADREEAAI